MANYEYCERTNYFAVRDVEGFKLLAQQLRADVIEDEADGVKIYGLLPCDEGFRSFYGNDEGGCVEISIMEELGKHVAPGWVACVVHGGHEKLRYIGYQLSCVDSAGRTWSKGNNDLLKEAMSEFAGMKLEIPEY